MISLSDKEHVELANREYDNLKINSTVSVSKGKKKIGEVSQINNNLKTGEQSYVITKDYVPANAPLSEREKVKEVTVLYRGSTGVDQLLAFDSMKSLDVFQDWILNDAPAAAQVAGQKGTIAPPQFKSAASSLKETLKTYPNAKVYIYGHSLGSMNGQYAIADLSKQQLNRIESAYLYQGPNIYTTLTPEQKKSRGCVHGDE